MRILNFLEQQDKELTVAELIEDIEMNQNIADKVAQAQIKECCDKYADTYLTKGNTKYLRIYHIDELKPAGKNTDYQQLYSIKGKIIRFNTNNVHVEDLMHVPHETISESELEEMKIISQEKYQNYVSQYFEIKTMLKNTIDNG